MLDLLYLLVKYGYYDDLKDIKELIPPLVSLLNGVNDKPYPGANDVESGSFREVKEYYFICMQYYVFGCRKDDSKTIV